MKRWRYTKGNKLISALLVVFFVAGTFGPALAAPAPGTAQSATPPGEAEPGVLDIQFEFASPPLLGEIAELVVRVTASEAIADAMATLILPPGMELIQGDLSWQGNIAAQETLEHRIELRVTEIGTHDIQVSLDGAAGGRSIPRQQKTLYVAAAKSMTSVSELPITIPEELQISAPDPVVAVAEEGAAQAELTPDEAVAAAADGPTVPAEVDKAFLQVDEGLLGGEAELLADEQGPLATIGGDGPEVPAEVDEQPVLVEGDSQGEIELLADSQVGIVAIGDDGPNMPAEVEEQPVQVEGDPQAELELLEDSQPGLITTSDDTSAEPTERRGKAIPLDASATPDLIVEDIWSTTNPPTCGDWERLVFRIKNQGAIAVRTRFYTRMWVDSTVVQTWHVDSLGAGATSTGAINVKVATGGNHVVQVTTDYTGVISESNESNNTRSETWNWGCPYPDLIVEDIWSTTNPLNCNDWENVTFRLKNQGGATAIPLFYTRMWLDTTLVQTWAVTNLPAGASITPAINVKVATGGNRVVKMTTDTTGVIAESDETNNSRSETWAFACVTKPDLIVDDIWSTTTPLTCRERENLRFRIRNVGTAAATPRFYTRMWIDGSIVKTWSVASLAAGSAAVGGINLTLATGGNHVIRVTTDYTGLIAESDETNNSRSETWNWACVSLPDLVIHDIWSTTTPLNCRVPERLKFRVRNVGTAAVSATFKSRMWIDGTVVRSWSTAGLAAGGAALGAVSVTLPTGGNHEIKVKADIPGVVTESNEGNNTRSETWRWACP